jgi:hypothetical protein
LDANIETSCEGVDCEAGLQKHHGAKSLNEPAEQ